MLKVAKLLTFIFFIGISGVLSGTEPDPIMEPMVVIPRSQLIQLINAYKAQQMANILLYDGLKELDSKIDATRSAGMLCS